MIIKESKESLIGMINSLGLTDTSKMLGLPIYEVLRLSGYEVTSEIIPELTSDLIIDGLLPSKHKEFTIGYDSDGILSWSTLDPIRTKYKNKNLSELLIVYATPYWDGDNVLPFDIEFYEASLGKDDNVLEDQPLFGEFGAVKLPSKFKNLEEYITFFNEIYIPKVYKMIMDNILPLLRDTYFN